MDIIYKVLVSQVSKHVENLNIQDFCCCCFLTLSVWHMWNFAQWYYSLELYLFIPFHWPWPYFRFFVLIQLSWNFLWLLIALTIWIHHYFWLSRKITDALSDLTKNVMLLISWTVFKHSFSNFAWLEKLAWGLLIHARFDDLDLSKLKKKFFFNIFRFFKFLSAVV